MVQINLFAGQNSDTKDRHVDMGWGGWEREVGWIGRVGLTYVLPCVRQRDSGNQHRKLRLMLYDGLDGWGGEWASNHSSWDCGINFEFAWSTACVHACWVASVVSDSVTLWTVACQAPLSMGFYRPEYWSGLQCPPPGDLPHPGIEPVSIMSPALAGGCFTTR